MQDERLCEVIYDGRFEVGRAVGGRTESRVESQRFSTHLKFRMLGTLKWYPMLALLPVYPKTPKCVVLDLELTSRKDIFSHVGEETEACDGDV